MKILFVLENHYPKIGGVETLFKNLTESLASKGHSITVLTNKSPSDNLLSRESYMPNLTIIRKNFFNRYIFTFFAWIPAFFLARKHDIIHTTSYNAGLPSYIAGLLSGKKVIITFHEVWAKMWFTLPHFGKISLYFHYLFEQLLLKLNFHKFIAVSQFTADSLSANGVSDDRIAMIYNGLDYSEFENIKKEASANEKFTFLYYGRLGISKGLDILISGAALLEKDFALKIIVPLEPKSLLDDLKKKIKEINLDDKVEMFHELSFDKLKSKVSSADTVIIPSYSEGFGFTATESIAMGVPVISSGNGSLAEVVSGKHLTMQSFDAEGLASCMERAMEKNFDHTEVKKFHLNDSVNNYIDLYATFKLDSSE